MVVERCVVPLQPAPVGAVLNVVLYQDLHKILS
jgi:hypothetical protein